MHRRLLAALLTSIVALAGLAAAALGMTSHAGWPTINGLMFQNNGSGDAIKHGTDKNDELLGHGGSDKLVGGLGDDVIWGDWDPVANGAGQHDTLDGGPGNDWIYSSHGFNTITGGAGNDHIKFHFGTGGSVNCGPGIDELNISHKLQKKVKISNCEVVSNKSLGF